MVYLFIYLFIFDSFVLVSRIKKVAFQMLHDYSDDDNVMVVRNYDLHIPFSVLRFFIGDI